jgi:hypothetical protein
MTQLEDEVKPIEPALRARRRASLPREYEGLDSAGRVYG